MDSTTLLVVLGGATVVFLLAVVGVLVWLVRTRPPGKGVAAALAGLIYTVSPVDAVPEVLLGPIGLVDDAAVIVATFLYVRHTVSEVRRAVDAGRLYQPPRRPGGPLPGSAPRRGLPRQQHTSNPRVRD